MVDLDLDLLLLNLVTHEGSKGTNTHLNIVPACLYLRCAGVPSHVGQQCLSCMGVIKTHLGPAQGDLERCFLTQRIMRDRRARDGPRPVARKSTMRIYIIKRYKGDQRSI